jgi:hypothetical protein
MMPPEDYEAKAKAVADSDLGQEIIRQVFLAADLLVGYSKIQDLPCRIIITRPSGNELSTYAVTIDINSNRKLH